MTQHKKRKALKREKAKRRVREAVAFHCSEAGPARCGECGGEVSLLFRADLALEAPNGVLVPGFGRCACGASVMSVLGPPQPVEYMRVFEEAWRVSAPGNPGRLH